MPPRKTRSLKAKESQEAPEPEEAHALAPTLQIPPMTPKTMKVTELREALAVQGLSAKGLKHELVDRLEAFLDDQENEKSKPVTSKLNTITKVDEMEELPPSPTKRRRPLQSNKKAQKQTLSEPEEAPQPDNTLPEAVVEGTRPEPSTHIAQSTPPTTVVESQANTGFYAHIRNFRRPFTVSSVRNLVGQFDQVGDFWMDSLKTQCFVKYATESARSDCIRKLSGLKWPVETGNVLEATAVTEEEKQRAIENDEKRPQNTIKSPPIPTREDEPLSLDEIFIKTTTLPQLYYLPACNLE